MINGPGRRSFISHRSLQFPGQVGAPSPRSQQKPALMSCPASGRKGLSSTPGSPPTSGCCFSNTVQYWTSTFYHLGLCY